MASATAKTRDERLNIRVSRERKALIAKAAEIERKNISDFVLENAILAAEALVADEANLTLNRKQWNKFLEALDAPPRNIPALRRLLTGPSIFDAQ
jgi:uncharacterized protein (DUF1778 family)